MELLRAAQAKGLKHGAVEDKLFLPGFLKLRRVVESGFLGRIIGFQISIRLVGVRRGRGRMPAPELELPEGGRRRTHLGHAPPLALHRSKVFSGPIARVAALSWTGQTERADEAGRALPMST